MKPFLNLTSCLFSCFLVSFTLSLAPIEAYATQPASGKSLGGYETLEMNHRKATEENQTPFPTPGSGVKFGTDN